MIPADFREAVARAEASGSRGDLLLFADELRTFKLDWQPEGLHLVEQATRRIGPVETEFRQVFLFTGHRIDTPERTEPRFPGDASTIRVAERMIARTLERESVDSRSDAIGIAGGASGGDILFHEACLRLGIRSSLYLAGPRDPYVEASVRDGGAEWVRRFDTLYATLGRRVLSDRLDLPDWLRSVARYSIWQRNNLWTLCNAVSLGARDVVLIALWNGEPGDGPGGTDDMIERARQRRARTRILDAKQLLARYPDRNRC